MTECGGCLPAWKEAEWLKGPQTPQLIVLLKTVSVNQKTEPHTKSTVFFLFVSARGPDVKVSHLSRASSWSSRMEENISAHSQADANCPRDGQTAATPQQT